jgi:hypothetical protein
MKSPFLIIIAFNEFLKPPSIIKAAFYIERDYSQHTVLFCYAHWTMSLSALRNLAQSIIEMSRELKTSMVYATVKSGQMAGCLKF